MGFVCLLDAKCDHIAIVIKGLNRHGLQMSSCKDLGVRPSPLGGDSKGLIGNKRRVYPGSTPPMEGASQPLVSLQTPCTKKFTVCLAIANAQQQGKQRRH